MKKKQNEACAPARASLDRYASYGMNRVWTAQSNLRKNASWERTATRRARHLVRDRQVVLRTLEHVLQRDGVPGAVRQHFMGEPTAQV